MKILVTGANGFVGQALLRRLSVTPEVQVLGAVRQRQAIESDAPGSAVTWLELGPHWHALDWAPVLKGVDVVVHLAARVHVLRDQAREPLQAYRVANVDTSVNLARHCAAAGVRRLVFMSTVKVHGEATAPGQPFRESDPPAPQDAYARSKLEAEQALRELAQASGLELVIIRPPLVYGPGVKANFQQLMRAVRRGWWLPLGAVHNQRSMVAVDNLVDLVVVCLTHGAAANQTFLVSDAQDLSSAELVAALARAQGVPTRLLAVAPWLLSGVARLLGRGAQLDRLCNSLQVDCSKARQVLGWVPPLSVQQGLQRAVKE